MTEPLAHVNLCWRKYHIGTRCIKFSLAALFIFLYSSDFQWLLWDDLKCSRSSVYPCRLGAVGENSWSAPLLIFPLCLLMTTVSYSLHLSFSAFCSVSPLFLFICSSRPFPTISPFDLWKGRHQMKKTTLSGFVSGYIFIFMSKSLRDFIAICLSVYLVHWGFSLASVTHKGHSHSWTCVGAAVHWGRRCETREA